MGALSIGRRVALLLAVVTIAAAHTTVPQTLIPRYPPRQQHASAPLQQPGYVPRPRWMAGYPHKTLRQLRLPGTHDSGTYAWTLPQRWPFPLEEIGTMVFNLVGDLSRTQTLSIYDQLMAGARVFDLRLAVNPWIVQQARLQSRQYNATGMIHHHQPQQQQQQEEDTAAQVECTQQQPHHQHQQQHPGGQQQQEEQQQYMAPKNLLGDQQPGMSTVPQGAHLGGHTFRVLQPPPGAVADSVLAATGKSDSRDSSSSSSTYWNSVLAAAARLDRQLSRLQAYSAQLSSSFTEAELRSSLVLAHSIPGVRWSEALADFARFMKDNPTEVVVLHIVRATLDANVAGVIDMYPSAWAAAAEMLAEALHGARLLTLEQAYHTPLHQLWPTAPQGSLIIFSEQICEYAPSPSATSSSSSVRSSSSRDSSRSSDSSSGSMITAASRWWRWWLHRSAYPHPESEARQQQQQQQQQKQQQQQEEGDVSQPAGPAEAAAAGGASFRPHRVTLSPGDLECHSSHLLLESWFNGTATEFVPDLLQRMIAWLTTWSAAGWPNMSRPAFLLASAQITLEANTIWQLIWNHIGGWAAAAEAADTHRAAATAGRKAAVGAGSGASALSQGQAGQGQPRPQQYGQTGRWRYNSTVRTLYEEGVLANQQLLDAVLRNKQVPPSFSIWSMDALDSDLVAAVLDLNEPPPGPAPSTQQQQQQPQEQQWQRWRRWRWRQSEQ